MRFTELFFYTLREEPGERAFFSSSGLSMQRRRHQR